MDPAKSIFIAHREPQGPFTIAQIRALWLAGELTGNSLYWQEGAPDWRPMAEVTQLIERASLSPPPSGALPPTLPPALPQLHMPLRRDVPSEPAQPPADPNDGAEKVIRAIAAVVIICVIVGFAASSIFNPSRPAPAAAAAEPPDEWNFAYAAGVDGGDAAAQAGFGKPTEMELASASLKVARQQRARDPERWARAYQRGFAEGFTKRRKPAF